MFHVHSDHCLGFAWGETTAWATHSQDMKISCECNGKIEILKMKINLIKNSVMEMNTNWMSTFFNSLKSSNSIFCLKWMFGARGIRTLDLSSPNRQRKIFIAFGFNYWSQHFHFLTIRARRQAGTEPAIFCLREECSVHWAIVPCIRIMMK